MKPHLAVAFVLFAGWTNLQPTDYFLDLAAMQESTEEELAAVPIGERVGAVPPRPLPFVVEDAPPPFVPFELDALTFDRSDYRLADPFTYEVTLRYVGSAELKFPISGKKHLFRQNMSGLRQATTSIEFEDAEWKHQIVYIRPLYGSDEVAGSLLTLTANQTIRIRAEGRWRLSAANPPPPTWAGSVFPFAALQVRYTPVGYRGSRSGTTSTIYLAPRQ